MDYNIPFSEAFFIYNAFDAYKQIFDYPFDTQVDYKDGVISISLYEPDHGLKETISFKAGEIFNLKSPTYEIYLWLCETHEKLSKGE